MLVSLWFSEPIPFTPKREASMLQVEIEEVAVPESETGALDPIERAFWEFHSENPDVYRELRSLALSLKGKGHDHYGIKALFEVVRFNRAAATSDETFKLNNNYSALYARLLMKHEKRLGGFFEIRERISRRALAEQHAGASP